jgi:hypothetical protein
VCLVVLRLLDSVELAVNVVVLNVGRREGQADAAGDGEGRVDLEAQHLLIACPKHSTKRTRQQRVGANYTSTVGVEGRRRHTHEDEGAVDGVESEGSELEDEVAPPVRKGRRAGGRVQLDNGVVVGLEVVGERHQEVLRRRERSILHRPHTHSAHHNHQTDQQKNEHVGILHHGRKEGVAYSRLSCGPK